MLHKIIFVTVTVTMICNETIILKILLNVMNQLVTVESRKLIVQNCFKN